VGGLLTSIGANPVAAVVIIFLTVLSGVLGRYAWRKHRDERTAMQLRLQDGRARMEGHTRKIEALQTQLVGYVPKSDCQAHRDAIKDASDKLDRRTERMLEEISDIGKAVASMQARLDEGMGTLTRMLAKVVSVGEREDD